MTTLVVSVEAGNQLLPAVYSAVGSLPLVEGQKQQITKYFISQVKHTSLRQLQKRNITVMNVQSG